MNPSTLTPKNVDEYLAEGCGRCSLHGTPECKVHSWQNELKALRVIALECGLTEEIKWGVPCYTYKKSNVLLISALKQCCTLSFMKGSLLKDPNKILTLPGENSQSACLIRFTSIKQINELEPILKTYIFEAIEVEKAGLKVEFSKSKALNIPEELQMKFDEDPALKEAFEGLTPGRQRGYVIHISGAKQSKTRVARIEKWIPQIFKGKGIHDR